MVLTPVWILRIGLVGADDSDAGSGFENTIKLVVSVTRLCASMDLLAAGETKPDAYGQISETVGRV